MKMNKRQQKYWFFTGFFLILGIAMMISSFFGANWLYLYGGGVLAFLGLARIFLAFKYGY